MLKTIDFELEAKMISEQTAQRKTCLFEDANELGNSNFYRTLKARAKTLAENIERVVEKSINNTCNAEGMSLIGLLRVLTFIK